MSGELLQQIINGLAWGSIYALIAIGYTMVYGVLRLINFAHGDVYMIGAMTGYYVAQSLGKAGESPVWRFTLVLLASMAVCAALGYLIERFAYRPLRQAPRIAALITAIGVSLFLEYAGQLLFGADPKFFPTLIPNHEWRFGDDVVVSGIHVLIFLVTLGLTGGLWLVVMKTRVGRAMRAVSYSHTASQLVGINLNKVISFTFILGSALAGVGSILVGMSNPKVEPLMGVMPGIKAFVAAVLGGIGSVPGAWVGGLVMGLSETFVTAYWSSTYRDALAFVLLIVILLVKPSGLFGKAVSEKV